MEGEWGPGGRAGEGSDFWAGQPAVSTGRAPQAMPGPAFEGKACPCENEGSVNVSTWLSVEEPSAAPDK